MILEFFNYNIIFLYLFLSIIISCVLLIVSMFIPQGIDEEKLSAYECGFDPFSSNKIQVSIQYYLVAILFIIFDLEIIYILPWLSIVKSSGFLAYISVIIFLILLIIGFVYEWIKNALDWN